ncbi:hypothetical protein [Nguyenibacter vanlangensis]|uniref:Uncharacterized protein n=1 Tax=Nguyenibacter vanlangensis TaxID=1216886 RepID=A0A7Y7IVM0_9PROT|nr:hypothetical protein [Nguyenibacter vanlangensis]NVN10591.1 hypothetical protein [Nguyenibacter vanlangensis]
MTGRTTDSPATDGAGEADSLRQIGFSIGGPALAGFLNWVERRRIQDGIAHVLVASPGLKGRHTQIGTPDLHWIGPPAQLVLAGIDERNFIRSLPSLLTLCGAALPQVGPRIGPLSASLSALGRLGIPLPAESVMRDLGLDAPAAADQGRLVGFLCAWQREILKTCRRNRRALLRTLQGIGLGPDDRVALVDIRPGGGLQQALAWAAQDLMRLDVSGYYLCLPDGSNRGSARRPGGQMTAMLDRRTVPSRLLRHAGRHRHVIDALLGASDSPGLAPLHPGMAQFARAFAQRTEPRGGPDAADMARPLLTYLASGAWRDHPVLWRIAAR